METVRTMGDKLREAMVEIRAEHPDVIGLYAAPPKQETDGRMSCDIFACDEYGKPVGEVLKVVYFV